MYASIRKYRIREDQVPDALHRVDETFAPRLEAMEGFVAYEVIDCGQGRIYSFTLCRDEEAAERSVELAGEFVEKDLADMEIERLTAESGEVSVSRAMNEVLEPAHA